MSSRSDEQLSVLVVDDHDVVHWGFKLLLSKQPWVGSCASATGAGCGAVACTTRTYDGWHRDSHLHSRLRRALHRPWLSHDRGVGLVPAAHPGLGSDARGAIGERQAQS